MAWMKVVALLLWSHITQRPFRTGLTIVGVALGVAASVAAARSARSSSSRSTRTHATCTVTAT